MIEGKKVEMGGRVFIVPPLPMKVFRTNPEWLKAIRDLSDIPDETASAAMVGLIHAAIHRNHPEVTVDELEELLDVRTALMALAAVMDMSGFVQAPKTGGATPES